jgi:hypothetical protein
MISDDLRSRIRRLFLRRALEGWHDRRRVRRWRAHAYRRPARTTARKTTPALHRLPREFSATVQQPHRSGRTNRNRLAYALTSSSLAMRRVTRIDAPHVAPFRPTMDVT